VNSAFEQLAEQKIEEAIRNGAFDDIIGKDIKLDLDGYLATPEHLRMSHTMLKSNGYVPPEVEMMQRIHDLEQQLLKCDDERQEVRLEREIQFKKTELAMAMDRMRAATRANGRSSQAW